MKHCRQYALQQGAEQSAMYGHGGGAQVAPRLISRSHATMRLLWLLLQRNSSAEMHSVTSSLLRLTVSCTLCDCELGVRGGSKLLARWVQAQLIQSIRLQFLAVGAVGTALRQLTASNSVQVCHSFDNGVGAEVCCEYCSTPNSND